MDYYQDLQYHYRPAHGWISDPNGLAFFRGYYHVFYQHAPHREQPFDEPMHWGHAITRDFLHWEELAPALVPDQPYDKGGCWSGTALVKEDTLYLFYASVDADGNQRVSVAYSTDGVRFEKYPDNPVIASIPADGSRDFRDPAVACIDGRYYLVMATGHPETKQARLLLYESSDLFSWEYRGIMAAWDNGIFTECPSFMQKDDKCLLTASVCLQDSRSFSAMYGSFPDGRFTPEITSVIDQGPDQYAGQAFRDDRDRLLLITWIPGWDYAKKFPKNIGCMSIPRELSIRDGKITGYPPAELQHLLKDSDEAVTVTESGFEILREGRNSVVYTGPVRDLKILRDGPFIEVFVNGGEKVYSALL